MEKLSFSHVARQRAEGSRKIGLIGVVASGNLEVMAERLLPGAQCEVDIDTAAEGFGAVWQAVIEDFVERYSPGGLRFSINDGGARPDTVSLRLAQAARLMQEDGQ
jgi:malonate decarboxylase delta subunit